MKNYFISYEYWIVRKNTKFMSGIFYLDINTEQLTDPVKRIIAKDNPENNINDYTIQILSFNNID